MRRINLPGFASACSLVVLACVACGGSSPTPMPTPTPTPVTDGGLAGQGGDAGSGTAPDAGTPAMAALTVQVTGNGTVTSAPAGLGCTGTCTADFPAGTKVAFSAAPGVGYRFDGWGGACSGVGGCAVTASDQLTIYATFVPQVAPPPQTFTLTVALTGGGSGSVTSSPSGIACGATCSAAFAANSSVVLTASASGGATFTGWSDACAGASTCTVSMSADQSVSAQFTPAPPPPPTGYTVQKMTAPPESSVRALNASATVVGSIFPTMDSNKPRAFLFDGSGGGHLVGPTDKDSTAVAIDDNFDITVNVYEQNSNGGTVLHALLLKDGGTRDLGSLSPGGSTIAWAMNNAAMVAGSSLSPANWLHGFVADAGGIHDLGTLDGTFSEAFALNNSNVAVGDATTGPNRDLHAVVFQAAGPRDLGTLGGAQSRANGINDGGVVVGWSTVPASGGGTPPHHGFLLNVADGVMHDVGALPGDDASELNAINGAGQAVGSSGTTVQPGSRAVLYDHGVMVDLNTLITDPNWKLMAAVAINAKGQILGYGSYQGKLPDIGFLLTPR